MSRLFAEGAERNRPQEVALQVDRRRRILLENVRAFAGGETTRTIESLTLGRPDIERLRADVPDIGLSRKGRQAGPGRVHRNLPGGADRRVGMTRNARRPLKGILD